MTDSWANVPRRIKQYRPELTAAGVVYQIDPLLLGAIMDRETLGGESEHLKPRGPAGRGDEGHGRGLMQIDDRYHSGFIQATTPAGKPLWEIPAFNILYAAWLLKENLNAFTNETAPAVAAYNAGVRRVRNALVALGPVSEDRFRVHAVDAVTTGGNYSADVLKRRARFSGEGPPTLPEAKG